jgi:hypothetical protein
MADRELDQKLKACGAEAARRETPADTAAPEGAIFMPLDVIVGRDTPAPVAVLMQNP